MRWGGFSFLLVMVGMGLGAVGCGAGDDGEQVDLESAELSLEASGGCGTTLGAAVSDAASKGESNVPGRITWYANDVVGGPVVGADALVETIVDMIGAAQHEVILDSYVIQTGSKVAERVRDAVAKVDHDRVKVWIMDTPHSDPLSNLPFWHHGENADQDYHRLRDLFPFPNVRVAAWDTPDLLTLDVNHTKFVLVDGQRALILDANLQTTFDPVSQKGNGWFGMGLVVSGGVVQAMRAQAAEAWHEHSHPHAELDAPPPPVTRNAHDCTRMVLLGRRQGAGETSSADRGYGAFFRGAKRSVHAITPNLNDDGALQALADATADADVYLILSKGFNDKTESLPGQGGTNEHNVWRLAGMAANRHHLHVRWFAHTGGSAVNGNGNYASHSKWATADGQVTLIGSQNLDTQSWKKSRELTLAVDDAPTTAKFDAVFHDIWDRGPVAYEYGMKEPDDDDDGGGIVHDVLSKIPGL